MIPGSWTLIGNDQGARAGLLHTAHGDVATPAFMPVGTRAAVRGVDVDDLAMVHTDMVLANTYHLMLRPGASVIESFGGLHRFWGWSGPILTDSGGYQIFSLRPQISEAGARFRSTYDGSPVDLSPEGAVRIQEALGPDLAMVLDVCSALPASQQELRLAMDLTLRWAERSLAVHEREDQALLGIIQGGVDLDLRAESAKRTAELGFVGFGVGGLSVGESPAERNRALEATVASLPLDKVRYVMGLGDPIGVLEAVSRGADLFDCVWPTRLARHGRVFTASGDYNLRRAENINDDRPLDPACSCYTCRTHHRGYLRHLLVVNETSAFRLVSIHNLTYTLNLMASTRAAISEGRFASFFEEQVRMRIPDLDGTSSS